MVRTESRDLQESNWHNGLIYKKKLTRICTELLEPIRQHFFMPVIISSAFRTPELNHRIGGSITSQHCVGEAADFNLLTYTSDQDKRKIIKWIWQDSGLKFRQLIFEYDCIHISLPHGTESDGQVFELNMTTKQKRWYQKRY